MNSPINRGTVINEYVVTKMMHNQLTKNFGILELKS